MGLPMRPLKEQKCKVDSCSETNLTCNLAKGYCIVHYGRMQRHNDPNIISIYKGGDIVDGMQLCRKKLHQYPETAYTCPECKKVSVGSGGANCYQSQEN